MNQSSSKNKKVPLIPAHPRASRFATQFFGRSQILLLAGFVLSFFGLLVSLLTSYSDMFSRSGSMIVALAVVSVYINHFIGIGIATNSATANGQIALVNLANHIDEKVKSHKEYNNNLERQPVELERAVNILRNQNPGQEDKLLAQAAIFMAKGILESRSRLDVLKEIQPRVVRAEFVLAFGGTLIWGFGDVCLVTNCSIFWDWLTSIAHEITE